MNNILKVKKDQLKTKLGKIVPFDYIPKHGENIIHAYLGEVPVTFASTSLTQENFNKLC